MMDRTVVICDHEGNIISQTALDVDWITLRTERNQELQNTDWRAVTDRTMSQAWKDYRQALRDLPQQFESANEAADNWPTPPE
jgi:hypothetical protein